MSRTVFVNPAFENPRGRRKRGRKSRKKARGRRRSRKPSYRGSFQIRRNAGITPFVQNPLILSNPRRRRTRRRNPMGLPSFKSMLEGTLSHAGGATLALGVNVMGTSKIDNEWFRRGAQLAVAAVGGSVAAQQSIALGHAFAGAMMYPLIQDIAADLLGIGVGAGLAAKEADIDALAADLEDVLDEMSPEDASDYGDDDDDEYAW